MIASSLALTARTQWRALPTLRHVRVPWSLRRHNHSPVYGKVSPKPRSIKTILEWKPEKEVHDVVVDGWVRSVRAMKKRAFITLGDGSSLAPLQAVISGGDIQGYVSTHRFRCSNILLMELSCSSVATGAAVRLTGSWRPSEGAGQSHELQVATVQVLGPSDATVCASALAHCICYQLMNLFNYRHFRFRRSTRLRNFYELCLIFGREPHSTQPFSDSVPKWWLH